MTELIEKVQELVAFELNRANTIHPPKFNSMHEAYAVIAEEFEETQGEMAELEERINLAWSLIKHDRPEIEVYPEFSTAEAFAEFVAAEAIQVAAMCRKARL